jgi:iron complex outermembrane receptor protein
MVPRVYEARPTWRLKTPANEPDLPMNRLDVRNLLVRPQRLRPTLVVAAALLVWGSMPVAAQTPEADTVPRFNMDSVVVNVLMTPVRVGASPFPISVAGAAELREGKTGMFLEDALESLPGVQVQNRFNFAVGERVSIRGFGSRAQFGVRGIQVEVDGIPATLPDGQSTLDHVDIGSLGRVEALRGPASALYGNAAGGVLRFESEAPPRTPLREEATAVVGSDGLVRLQSVTAGTVGTTGYSFSVDKLDYEGYRNDVTPEEAPYGSADRLHIVGRLVQPMGGGELGLTLNHLSLDAENPGSLRLNVYEEEATRHSVWPFSYTNFQTGKEVQQSQFGVTWSGPVGGLDADVSAYGLTRDFLNPLPGDVVDVDRRAGGVRMMLGQAFSSGDVGVEIRGGVEGDFQNDDRREFDSNGGVPDTLRQNQTERVRGTGVFLQTSLSFSERITLMGGVRYDHTYFEVEDLYPVSAGNADDSGARDMNKVSPSVGIHVAATPEVGLFANYARSFETPTTVELGNRESGAGGFNPNLDPMTGKTFEVGTRGTVQDLFSYEVSYFHTSIENEIIKRELMIGGSTLDYFSNVGSTTRNGLEIVARARPHDLVTVQGSYHYIDAKFDEYIDKDGNDFSGNEVPGLAPKQAQGSIRFGPSEWFLEIGTEYTASMQVNDANVDNVVAGVPLTSTSARPTNAYTLFDVRVGGNALQVGGLEVSPFGGVQNLGDKTYVSSVAINAFGNRFYEPGPGRTFYVGATLAVAR